MCLQAYASSGDSGQSTQSAHFPVLSLDSQGSKADSDDRSDCIGAKADLSLRFDTRVIR